MKFLGFYYVWSVERSAETIHPEGQLNKQIFVALFLGFYIWNGKNDITISLHTYVKVHFSVPYDQSL